jgi:hypothetical protein
VEIVGAILFASTIGCSPSAPVVSEHYAVKTTFAENRTATLQSQANMVGVRSEDQQAVFYIDDATIVITTTSVTSSRGQSIPLPSGWSHLELAHDIGRITIHVDGKTIARFGFGA